MDRETFENEYVKDTKKPLGVGMEKDVYEQKDRIDGVVKVERKAESPRKVRARFYLLKILHMLYPKNIPDIHFSFTEPNATGRDKVELDEDHNRMRDLIKNNAAPSENRPFGGEPDTEQFNEASRRMWGKLNDAKFPSYVFHLGVGVEMTAKNFGLDGDGNFVYVDDFPVWGNNEEGGISPIFNEERIRESIGKLSGEKQKQAVCYLERLLVIYKEESDFLKKSRKAK
ncbi:MAG: hypothetical protein Q7S86_04615 [bacterium]|nr:hypothetical protein [bacterium]